MDFCESLARIRKWRDWGNKFARADEHLARARASMRVETHDE